MTWYDCSKTACDGPNLNKGATGMRREEIRRVGDTSPRPSATAKLRVITRNQSTSSGHKGILTWDYSPSSDAVYGPT
jgi:hypothetical protein